MKLYSRTAIRPIPKEFCAGGETFRMLFGVISNTHCAELIEFSLENGYSHLCCQFENDPRNLHSASWLYGMHKSNGHTVFTGILPRDYNYDNFMWFAILNDDVIAHVILTFA